MLTLVGTSARTLVPALLVLTPLPASAQVVPKPPTLVSTLVPTLVSAARGALTPGGMVFVEVAPEARVFLDGEAIAPHTDGGLVFGFGMNARHARLAVDNATQELALKPRLWREESIRGQPQKFRALTPEALAKIRQDAARKRAARAKHPYGGAFTGFTRKPVAVARISGVYGSRRVYDGKPGRPHAGLDLAAPTGTEVVAPAPGIVVLAGEDFFYEGGLIFIDHGQEILSAFLHLDTVAVAEGAQVVAGQGIGTIGATGRATGPHLDWRVYWRGRALDPALALRLGALRLGRLR